MVPVAGVCWAIAAGRMWSAAPATGVAALATAGVSTPTINSPAVRAPAVRKQVMTCPFKLPVSFGLNCSYDAKRPQ